MKREIMKRELKFRAWNESAKRYSKPFTLTCDVLNFTDDDGLGVIKSLTNEVVEQFTGLEDKNGKDIYEGDIVSMVDEYYEGDYKHYGFNGVVKYYDGSFDLWGNAFDEFMFLDKCSISHYGYEVVGNMHETNLNQQS